MIWPIVCYLLTHLMITLRLHSNVNELTAPSPLPSSLFSSFRVASGRTAWQTLWAEEEWKGEFITHLG